MPKKTLPKTAPAEVQIQVERILNEHLHQPVELDVGTPLTQAVYRFRLLSGPDQAPATVIAKHRTGSRQKYIFNEWAALQLLTECAAEGESVPAPRFYGGCLDPCLLVIEDLGEQQRLEEIAMGKKFAVAHRAVVDFARSLGRIHGLTAGRRPRYEEIYLSIGHPYKLAPPDRRLHAVRLPPDHQSGMHGNLHLHYVDMFLALCRAVDLEPHPQLQRQLESIRPFLTDPDHPFLTMTHEDIYPVNAQYKGDSMRIIDFEWSQYRHALSDGIKCRTALDGWVYQWAIPREIERQMEAAYRTELARGCPRANDDGLFNRALAEAAVMETIIGIYRHDSPSSLFDISKIESPAVPQRMSDQEIYEDRCRRLVQRCRLLAQVTRAAGYLEAVGETAQHLETKCRALWPERVFEMRLFPAFEEHGEATKKELGRPI